MIIRKLAEAIGEQNWFTVVLEILIVVIGIFIGLQVDDWNEARKQRQREAQSLDRLYAESIEIVTFFKDRLGNRIETILAVDPYVRAISLGEPVDNSGIGDRLVFLSFYPAVSPPGVVYDELTGSGRFSEISSTPVREVIGEYNRSLDFLKGQTERFYDSSQLGAFGPDDGLRSIYDPERPSRIRREIDADRLFANPVYRSELVRAFRNYIRYTQYVAGTLEAAYDMCIALASATGEDKGACPEITAEQLALEAFLRP